MKARIFLGWRITNSTLLLFGFLAPWFVFVIQEVSHQYSGPDLLLELARRPESLELDVFLYSVAPLLSIPLYILVNVVAIATATNLKEYRWATICFSGLSLRILLTQSDSSRLALGAWFTLIGLISSAILEILSLTKYGIEIFHSPSDGDSLGTPPKEVSKGRDIGYLGLCLFVVLTIGSIGTSYAVAFALVTSTVIAIATRIVVTLLNQGRLKGFVQLFWRWAVVSLLFLMAWLLYPGLDAMFHFEPGVVKEYKAIIEPTGSGFDSFIVREEVLLKGDRYEADLMNVKLEGRQIDSTSRGYFLREVTFMPLQADVSSGQVDLTLPDGTHIGGELCDLYIDVAIGRYKSAYITRVCPEANIELRDMPTNSLFAVKDAAEMKTHQYIDAETVTWSSEDLSRGITFAYIPPPYHYFRRILSPFVDISFLNQWFIVVVGFAVTFILSSVLKPFVLDITQNKLQVWYDKSGKNPQAQKATLIISSRGDEKEIEVKEKRE